MAANFALFLSPEGIALAHRQDAGHWAFIGETRIDVPDLDSAIAELHAKAVEREGEAPDAVIILPEDQVLYTSFMAPASDEALTRVRIEDGLDGLTPYPVSELVYDFRAVEEDRVKVAVAAEETLEEARGFAKGHGFNAVGFAAMPPTERFPGAPIFTRENAIDIGISPDGLEFGPDKWRPQGAKGDDAATESDASTSKGDNSKKQAADTAAPVAPAAGKAEGASAQPVNTTRTPAPAKDTASHAEADAQDQAAPTDTTPQTIADTSGDGDRADKDAPQTGPGDLGLSEPVKPLIYPEDEIKADNPGQPVAAPDDAPKAPVDTPSAGAPGNALRPQDAKTGDQVGAAAEASVSVRKSEGRRKLRFTATEPAPPAPVPGPTGADASRPEPEPGPTTDQAPSADAADSPQPSLAGGANKTPAKPPAAADKKETPKIGFSVRRGKDRPDAARTGDLVAQRKSRLAFNVTPAPSDGQRLHPDADVRPSRTPSPDKLTDNQRPSITGQLARVRDAAKARPRQADDAPNPLAGKERSGAFKGTSRPSPPTKTAPIPLSKAPPTMRRTALDPPEPTTPAGPSRLSRLSGSISGATAGAIGKLSAAPRTLLAGRRRTRKPKAEPEPGIVSAQAVTDAEDSLSTGLLARKPVEPTGASLRTGLILTVVLLVLLVAIAVWSVLFLPNGSIARLFSTGEEAASSDVIAPDVVVAPPGLGRAPTEPDAVAADRPAPEDVAQPPAEPEPTDPAVVVEDVAPEVVVADPEPSDAPVADPEPPAADTAVVIEPLPPVAEDALPSLEETQQAYAEYGIWARTPERPELAPFSTADDLYVAGIDPVVLDLDAIALSPAATDPFETFDRIPAPPPFGSAFDIGVSGLVEPTPEGVLTPTGAFVRLGRPPVEAVQRPRALAPDQPEAAATQSVEDAILGTFRPTPRPLDLEEVRQRQVLGGLTSTELAALRPSERPEAPTETAAQASLFSESEDVDVDVGGTALAVASSRMPRVRPPNIDALIAAATRAPVEETAAVPASAVAPQPSVPSSASVTRAATERNAIRLRNVNLIGVTGTPSNRTALVRLPSGRFVRVSVGDRLDGGRVAAISENSLQYVRSGRNITLEIPG